MTQPFSVKIFLADGDPAGIKVVEKSNWTVVGLVFNPISPVYLHDRSLWAPINVVGGILFLVVGLRLHAWDGHQK